MMDIVISSGHGLHIRGASGIIDEVDEARRVVDTVAQYLRRLGVGVAVFHDDVSDDQSENLERIVDFHNSQDRDRDVSVHFNAYEPTDEPMGCEVLYVTEEVFAEELSEVMANVAGFINRGAKQRNDLYFLNQTNEPAVLAEICFVDSVADTDAYADRFDRLCKAIAITLAGTDIEVTPDRQPLVVAGFSGKCSWFGGPDDTGVDPDEGLAFIYDYDTAPDLFLDEQPPGTSGLARRLDPDAFYVACRWDYDVTSKDMLADQSRLALVRAKRTGKRFFAHPADWGPHQDTGRAADLSPGLLEALGIGTDDEVVVIYPAPADSMDAEPRSLSGLS